MKIAMLAFADITFLQICKKEKIVEMILPRDNIKMQVA